MNCAVFDGQSTVPQVHIRQTVIDLPASALCTFLDAMFATRCDFDAEEDEGECWPGGGSRVFGRQPLSTGLQPERNAFKTV